MERYGAEKRYALQRNAKTDAEAEASQKNHPKTVGVHRQQHFFETIETPDFRIDRAAARSYVPTPSGIIIQQHMFGRMETLPNNSLSQQLPATIETPDLRIDRAAAKSYVPTPSGITIPQILCGRMETLPNNPSNEFDFFTKPATQPIAHPLDTQLSITLRIREIKKAEKLKA